jgi:hypothetical protein
VFLGRDVARGYFEQHPDAAAEFWGSARIVFDRDGAAARLRAEVEALLARPELIPA